MTNRPHWQRSISCYAMIYVKEGPAVIPLHTTHVIEVLPHLISTTYGSFCPDVDGRWVSTWSSREPWDFVLDWPLTKPRTSAP